MQKIFGFSLRPYLEYSRICLNLGKVLDLQKNNLIPSYIKLANCIMSNDMDLFYLRNCNISYFFVNSNNFLHEKTTGQSKISYKF